MRSSLATWVDHWGGERGEAPAIVFAGTQLSWAQFAARVRTRAGQLAVAGVGPGDRVGCLSHNRPEYLEVFWAAQRLGAVFVALNTRLAPPELARIITNADLSMLVREDDTALVTVEAVEHLGARLPPVIRLAAYGEPFELDVPGDAAVIPDAVPAHADDAAAILYTSGSTGLPKGAVITHGNIMALTQMWQASYGQSASDSNLVCMPLCFTGGLLASSTTSVCTGARLVIMRSFDPAEALRLIPAEGVTYSIVVPTMLERIVAVPGFADADLSSLRGLQVGGAAVTEATIRAVQARGVEIVNAYGLTEASAGANLTLSAEEAHRNPTAIGRPTLGTMSRIVGDGGEVAGPGTVGELQLSGPLVFGGYWRDPEASAAAIDGGWLRTGDLAEVDADGVFHMRGRQKDMIITGGLNVYPAEIERVLTMLPEIAEAAVIGHPDPAWGEAIVGLVLPRAGHDVDPEKVRAACRTELAGYKVPREVIVITEFPRLASGKINKIALRTMLAQEGLPGPASAR